MGGRGVVSGLGARVSWERERESTEFMEGVGETLSESAKEGKERN